MAVGRSLTLSLDVADLLGLGVLSEECRAVSDAGGVLVKHLLVIVVAIVVLLDRSVDLQRRVGDLDQHLLRAELLSARVDRLRDQSEGVGAPTKKDQVIVPFR